MLVTVGRTKSALYTARRANSCYRRFSSASSSLLLEDDLAWAPGWVDLLSSQNGTAIVDTDGSRVLYKDILTRATAVASNLRRLNGGNALDEHRGDVFFQETLKLFQ